jgi:transketolase
MCYLRTHRPDVPLLYAPDATFDFGGFNVLATGDDLALLSSGYMVGPAREAARLLSGQGVRVTLIDSYCLPVDAARLVDVLHRAGGRALVVEDNYGGAWGAAVAEIAAAAGNLKVRTLHCNRIAKSARTPEEILDYCGVGPTQIADHALALLKEPC